MIFVDYFETAREMLITLEEFNPNLRVLHTDEDVTELALFLEKTFEPDLIADLAGDRLGIGILIGMASAIYNPTEEADGIEDYQEAEEGEGESETQDTAKQIKSWRH